MKSPFISICIPVYNMAPYLRECLDSILNQSFADWEAVCTDDGSTDESGTILDEYAQRDPRIKVIHQKNGGLCNARNAALDRATGLWMWFVDSDDVLLKDALALFHQLAKDNRYDGFCISRYFPFTEHCAAAAECPERFIATIDEPDIGKTLYFQAVPLRGLPFNRIVKREMFLHVRFIDGLKYQEDSINLVELLSNKARWAFVDCCLYGYRNRPNSISHGYAKEQCALELKAYCIFFEKAKSGLKLMDREFAEFVEQYRGSMQYYIYNGLAHETSEGLCKAAHAYDELVKIIGAHHITRFIEVRFLLAKMGILGVLAKPVRLCEYLYFGVRARVLKLGGKLK